MREHLLANHCVCCLTCVATTTYFFCSTGCSGTEGIRHVGNFVAFLAPYRATFQGKKQVKYHYIIILIFVNNLHYNVRLCAPM